MTIERIAHEMNVPLEKVAYTLAYLEADHGRHRILGKNGFLTKWADREIKRLIQADLDSVEALQEYITEKGIVEGDGQSPKA